MRVGGVRVGETCGRMRESLVLLLQLCGARTHESGLRRKLQRRGEAGGESSQAKVRPEAQAPEPGEAGGESSRATDGEWSN